MLEILEKITQGQGQAGMIYFPGILNVRGRGMKFFVRPLYLLQYTGQPGIVSGQLPGLLPV